MNRGRPSGFRRARGIAAIGLLLAATAAAQPTALTIGQGWAWVREFFPPSGERDVERIAWPAPPREADLDTLQVWGVRRPWPIRDWRWQTVAPADANAPLVWRPDSAAAAPPARDLLEIRLERPLSHRMGHSLTYRLPGFDWHAFYRIVVRGIGPESIQSVQVDLVGHLRIQNGTGTSFEGARVSLTGADDFLLPPPKPFGLLDLNPDSPLSDLWLSLRDPKPPQPRHYPLHLVADLPANDQADIVFARIDRKPAKITHVCDSDEIPSPTRSGGMPLRRFLQIPNTSAVGLGFALPPGEARLFLGAARGAPIQSGHVFHTPHPGTLQVYMGMADAVLATRKAEEPVALPEGAWQADHSVTIVNQLESPVHVQIVERPTTPLQWSLVRSSIPGVQSTRTLRFETTVPAKSAKTLEYRLRLVSRTP